MNLRRNAYVARAGHMNVGRWVSDQLCRSEVDAERDIPSLGVRTGGWVEVDVSAAAVVALGGAGSPNMF